MPLFAENDWIQSRKRVSPCAWSAYIGGSDLVSYHQCQVKYYTTLGARKAGKITLRCVDCQLLYNYSQFGNKRELGFRYYPEACRTVEATDTVYFQRELLEFQCSLA